MPLAIAGAWRERATSLSPNYAQGIYAQAWTATMAGSRGLTHVDFFRAFSVQSEAMRARLSVALLQPGF